MKYTHNSLDDPKSINDTREHVIAHLSSVVSPMDDENEFADQVTIDITQIAPGVFQITGEIDAEPNAWYLDPKNRSVSADPFARDIQRRLTELGCPWRILPGAQTRGNGQVWGDVKGEIVHHTATAFGKAPNVLIAGRSDLSGPLCNTAGEADGTIAFVAYHPANHAGASGGKSMGPLPVTRTFNKLVWGHEIVYPGVQPMTPEQYRSSVLLSRAIADVLDVDHERIRVHGETSITGKWDPGYANGKMINMAAYRRDVELAGQPVPPVKPTPAPVPPPVPKPPVVVGQAPAFPLPAGYYYGPLEGPERSISNRVSVRAAWLEGLRTWQRRMAERGWRISADGLYGDETERVARLFQQEKRLAADGLIGPATWAAAWTAPIN